MSKPAVICLTPVKNEAWILESFLKAASLWADYIIIADQGSTDGSKEIAASFPKVILIDNPSEKFNEPERQKLLLQKAREIDGRRLLITLDADEAFSPEILSATSWNKMLDAETNTVFYFRWANIKPGFNHFWQSEYRPFVFMDNGEIMKDDSIIHTTRIPIPDGHISVKMDEIQVIHFQYVDWERMKAKHRWYQCYERITFPQKSPLDIFRIYNHMYSIKPDRYIEIPSIWMDYINTLGVLSNISSSKNPYWWDKSILHYFETYGISTFRKLAIWDVDWNLLHQKWGRSNSNQFDDPRKISDKLIQWYLTQTQKKSESSLIKKTDKILKKYLNY